MYKIVFSKKFKKDLEKLISKNPKLKSKIEKTVIMLSSDPDHTSLRLHKLSGLENHSVSVSRSIRIIIYIDKNKIYLLEFGTHKEVY